VAVSKADVAREPARRDHHAVIELTIEDHVAHVRLNRPERHNALNGELMDALIGAAAELAKDSSVRVVVLSGNGRSFCSGLDMSNFGDMASGSLSAESDNVQSAMKDLSPGGANRPQQVGWRWRELEIPVIAAVHGNALGGGLNLALAADMRIVSPDARLAFVEITWGLMPDMSASQSLRRLVGDDRAKLLVLTGRPFSGDEAGAWGLATEVDRDPVGRALELAAEIAAHNPDAVRAALAVLNDSVDANTRDGLADEARISSRLIGTANQIEAVVARLEDRAPDFDGG
jgi:enoyl-CoA hydratase/carnithine racemase